MIGRILKIQLVTYGPFVTLGVPNFLLNVTGQYFIFESGVNSEIFNRNEQNRVYNDPHKTADQAHGTWRNVLGNMRGLIWKSIIGKRG